jgi:hypothetical protein
VSTTATPYLEVFGCRNATEDGCDHEDICDYGFTCGSCGRPVDDGPCSDHAPLDVPGLQLAECDTQPRHPRTWFLASDGYPPPCMYCSYDVLAENHAGCAHSHHWPWRRWKLTRSAAYRLTLLGVSPGAWIIHDGYCRGCFSGFSPRLSGYLLGWPRWKWSCLFRGRHWPGVQIIAGVCGKCAPCPACGSVVLEHGRGCTADAA